MAKTFEELFTPTLNGIAVSVRHVSSTPAVLPTCWVEQPVATQKNNLDDKKTEGSDAKSPHLQAIP